MAVRSRHNRIMRAAAAVFALALAALSCSTTRSLADGEYRLAQNKIHVTNDDAFNGRQVHQYIKQQPSGFTPFLYVYNWSGKDADTFMKRLYRRLGTAPTVYDPGLVDASIQNIENHLEYIGYYNSKVTSSVEVKNKNVTVNYNVTLGSRFPITEIHYNIPERGDFAEDFYADTVNVTVRPGSFLSEDLLDAESERSSAVLRDKGYYGFSKMYYSFEADTLTHPGQAILEMRVSEYTRGESEENAQPIKRYTIGDVAITRPSSIKFRDKVLKGMSTIKPGQPYSESEINKTYSRMSALKAFNSVNAVLTPRDSFVVDCDFLLTQSKIQSFKTVLETSSNSSGLIGISPQVTYSHKNIFHGGEWLNLSFLGNFQFKFNENTFSNEFGVSAGLSFPKLFGIPYHRFRGAYIPRTDISASYNFQDRPEYKRNVAALSFGYSGRIRDRLFYQYYPVQANIVGLKDIAPEFYRQLVNNPFLRYAYEDHFDEGAGMTLYYTTNSDVVPRESYHYIRFAGDLSGNVISLFNPMLSERGDGIKTIFGLPYSQYVRGELTLGKTWKFGKNNGQAIATRLLAGAGYAYGNSSTLPYEKQFYSGGANSLRGWQARSVGPGASELDRTFSIPSQTGDMKLEANLEYRFSLVWKLEGAGFIDAGNVWILNDKSADEKSRFDFKDFYKTIAADCGLGVRVDLSFILVRVDLGMKFYDPSLESRWIRPDRWLKKNNFALHFGVGYPF